MLRSLSAIVLLTLSLTACKTIAPSTLSALETQDLRFTSLEVRTSETAPISWTSAEDDYLRERGLSQTDPALTKTPEAKSYLRERAGSRLKAALDRVVAKRPPGTRPVRLVVQLNGASIPSVAQRVLVGGSPSIVADVEVYDARTNALLTTYKGAMGTDFSPNGVLGVAVDSAMVSGGMREDLYDRAANDYAAGFERWLSAPMRGGA